MSKKPLIPGLMEVLSDVSARKTTELKHWIGYPMRLEAGLQRSSRIQPLMGWSHGVVSAVGHGGGWRGTRSARFEGVQHPSSCYGD
ncbi:hypothetical protein HPP92_028867 [Vanilla planifolia]|uniref:Uncharacterized protein n=1 Tax=Vanilla planifolia TaxID=51239 RepID=A0A835P631_VANPL|nr:hypothetical protein HPP92_028867 [Vanilla planifolia]KAG0446384.1 hypothetical protein HPP92_028856 [Vanilla planifolia]